MQPLIGNDIESELSYAYLHAVASKAGAACANCNRHEDNRGVDAKITAWGPFSGGGANDLEEIDLKIQLKATIGTPLINDGYISYALNGINRYDDLRKQTLATHRILVVMFLPGNDTDWLQISEDELVLKKCAYWVSLRGAAQSANATSQTVYIPQAQIFNPTSLMDICGTLSRYGTLNYQMP